MTSLPPHVEHVQALVVGAGPVGLFAALCAARRGVRALLIDQGVRRDASGHSALLHGSTLELLGEAGLLPELEANGHFISTLSISVDGTRVTKLSLASPALAVTQSALEEALLAALLREGVEFRRAHRASTVEQHGDYVEVCVIHRDLTTADAPSSGESRLAESSTIRADFVIGADGYDSRVRAAISIEAMEVGRTESFAMFEVAHPSAASSDCEELGIHDELGWVALPLASGRRRFVFQVVSQLDAPADVARLRALIAERLRHEEPGAEALDSGTVISFQRRLARRFGRRRVWLAGDAAHVTSPLGGHSLNVGLLEARDLVQRIADSLRDRSGAHLERYASEREREWHKLFGLNVQFDLLPHAPRWLSIHARRLVPALPASGLQLGELLGRLGLRLS